MQRKLWATGLWKFSDKVPTKDLNEFTQQWAEDENYLQLYIRKVSKDQMGIGFTYRLPESGDDKKNYDAFFLSATDKLKRTFGNDLVGWDVSSTTWVIKYKNLSEKESQEYDADKATFISDDPEEDFDPFEVI